MFKKYVFFIWIFVYKLDLLEVVVFCFKKKNFEMFKDWVVLVLMIVWF